MTHLIDLIQKDFPNLNFKKDFPLSQVTHLKIGGPSQCYLRVTQTNDLKSLAVYAKKNQIPLTILGWASNTLISDQGLEGLVITNAVQEVTVGTSNQKQNPDEIYQKPQKDFWGQAAETSSLYDFADLDYQETTNNRIDVTVSSGLSLPGAINNLINQGITGSQWYAGIPGTIGGAIVNNIHGGTHLFYEMLAEVELVDEQGEIKRLPVTELLGDYDYSRFHQTKEIIIEAKLNCWLGDAKKAKSVAQQWQKRKSIQPQNTLGCTFKNISIQDQKRLNLPTSSVGYIIDTVLKMKGFQIGKAQISQKHAAFIENLGGATAKEYLEVIKTIQQKAKDELDLQLELEIFLLGFNK